MFRIRASVAFGVLGVFVLWCIAIPDAFSLAQHATAQPIGGDYVCYPGQFNGYTKTGPLKVADTLASGARVVSVPVGPPYIVCAPTTGAAVSDPSRGYLV